MSEELRPCPFCGQEELEIENQDGDIFVCCDNRKCEFRDFGLLMSAKSWNTRPIDDALRADLARKDALVASHTATLAREEEKYKRVTDEWGQEIKDLKEEVHLLSHYKEEVDACSERTARKDAEIAALEEALTPSKSTKGAYIGEVVTRAFDDDIFVSWVAIKQIMAMIRERARLAEVRGEE